MSVDGKMCRVCLAVQKTSRFNRIFGNNGKIAKQIYELSRIKILEFKQCPALICPKCTGNLQRAVDLKNSILDNNRNFNEIYKICRFEEFDIEITAEIVSDESDEWQMEVVDKNIETVDSVAESYDTIKTEEFEATEEIKQEPEDHNEYLITIFDNAEKDFIEIKSEIKQEPEQIKEFKFDDLPEDVLQALDSDDSFEMDDETLEVSIQSTSQQTKKRDWKDTSQFLLCSICGHKSSSEENRQEHLLIIHNQKRRKLNDLQKIRGQEWMCCYCGESFRTKADSVQHRKTEHKEEEESLNCRHCQMQFTKSHHLRIHIKYTHLEKSFICPKCNSKFDNQESFKAHMRIEKNQRNFVCKICSASFILKKGLKRHLKNHEAVDHSCEHCGVKFVTQKTLTNHIKAVHSKSKPFRCGSCRQTFELKYHLEKHLSKDNCLTK